MVALRDGVVERREEMKRVWEDVVADARMARKPVLMYVPLLPNHIFISGGAVIYFRMILLA